MFGQSNDLFYSNDRPIALFTGNGKPAAGEMTAQLSLWDAGTEVNEEPGLGPNQGPRQTTRMRASASTRASHTYATSSRIRGPDVLRLTVDAGGRRDESVKWSVSSATR